MPTPGRAGPGVPTGLDVGAARAGPLKTSHEVDVAVFGHGDNGDSNREALLAIGEAKWNDTMGIGHLQRLQHIRELLHAKGTITREPPRLMCFSGAGFTDELQHTVRHDHTVQLIDLQRLYHGE